MAKQRWRQRRGGRGPVRIGSILALLLLAGRAAADGPGSATSTSTTPDLQQREERGKQAMALHDEARELYAHGRYRAAMAKLEAALALDPDGKELVYNLGLIHERLGEVDPAARYYRRYLEMETAPKEREKIEGVLQRLAGAKQELVVEKDEAPAPPSTLPRASPAPPPAPPPAPTHRVGTSIMVTGAVGVMGLFTGTVLGISALARSPGSGAMTRPGVSADDLIGDARAAHRQAVGADVALLVGLAASGAAVALYSTSRGGPAPSPPRASPAAARVNLALGPVSGALRVSF